MCSVSRTALLFALWVLAVRANAAPPAQSPATAPTTNSAPTVRVAAIGGINDLNFWPELVGRFEKATGIHVETVATGNKDGIGAIFQQGGIDLITMQSGDAILNLVATGYAMDPQPWMQSDLVIVGPTADPAGIKGMTDASAAVKKIVESESAFVVHGNSGVDEVVRGILQADRGEADSDHTTVLLDDHQRRVLQVAADKKAYTLIARVPFLSGKVSGDDLVLMVSGDPVLRRPFVVAVADPAKVNGAHLFEARRLAAFLRADDTQRWIGEFGNGKVDDRSLYIPLKADRTTPNTGAMVIITGQVKTPLALDAAMYSQFPRHQVRVKDHNGKESLYEGVFLSDLLKQAGVPLGNHQMRGPNLSLCLVVEAADGYRAVFTLSELDEEFGDHSILLASQRDGQPLDEKEGPLRVIAPQEGRQARWVRRVTRLIIRNVE